MNENHEALQTVSDEELLQISEQIMEQNREVYEELAK